ncbi:hypothetical protein TNCT_556381 [Trichonephila clavata]|uniref:Uncharacterized protein n=1 Tax=Trichonephila clavata TaxID=2740835 RepID=A0A8X6H002_TRICU|nr:hypothetical protein TNCT_556381 [Trichonephila clavata]
MRVQYDLPNVRSSVDALKGGTKQRKRYEMLRHVFSLLGSPVKEHGMLKILPEWQRMKKRNQQMLTLESVSIFCFVSGVSRVHPSVR